MKPVYQTIFGKPLGNCLQAAVASLLELELDEVPNFNEFGNDWNNHFIKFFRKHKMIPIYSENLKDQEQVLKGYHLMIVETDRGLPHTVIGYDGKVVFDPYPGGSNITKIIGYDLFIVHNPAWLVDRPEESEKE